MASQHGRRVASVLGICLITLALVGATRAAIPRHRPRVSVLIIGGSAADGWLDRTHQGYVVRGLKDYARAEGIRVAIVNHAIPGARVVNPTVARWFGRWVYDVGPGAIVVIAWGMLNDLKRHTPDAAIMRALRHQIGLALAAHDTVLIVTPPATRASYRPFRRVEPHLIADELSVARAFHSRRLFIVNVFHRERTYLARHRTPITRVTRGPFHPNTAGARLGGELLALQLEKIWGPPPQGAAAKYVPFPR